MSCGLPHVELDAAIASVRKVLKLAIENEQFPERELDRLWDCLLYTSPSPRD